MEDKITLQRVSFEEMAAPEGKYLTQAADVADTERLYFTRRPLLIGEAVADWRVADEEERAAWKERLNKMRP